MMLGFDLSDIHRQHKVKEETPSRLLTEVDHRFAVTTPDSWIPHFEKILQDETVKTGFKVLGGTCPELSTSTVRMGGQFTLSKEWRDTLRERCGLTPTSVITVSELTFFPGTKVIDRLRIESNQHIAVLRDRKHLLQAYTITNFTSFALEVEKQIELSTSAKKAADPKVKTRVTKTPVDTSTIVSDYL